MHFGDYKKKGAFISKRNVEEEEKTFKGKLNGFPCPE